ncbi:MAG: hypothetical protein RIR74_1406 [Pseudomonadota bacterium]
MSPAACPIETVFREATPRLKAVQAGSHQVAVSLEQLIRLLVSDGPELEAALPRLKAQASQRMVEPLQVVELAKAISAAPALRPAAAPVAPPAEATPILEQGVEPQSSTDSLWLPYEELEALLRNNSSTNVRPLMEALLLQSLASQAVESSAEPTPARQAA